MRKIGWGWGCGSWNGPLHIRHYYQYDIDINTSKGCFVSGGQRNMPPVDTWSKRSVFSTKSHFWYDIGWLRFWPQVSKGHTMPVHTYRGQRSVPSVDCIIFGLLSQ